jgi:hypothetical protein
MCAGFSQSGPFTRVKFSYVHHTTPHYTAGDVLREQMHQGTAIGRECKEFVNNGAWTASVRLCACVMCACVCDVCAPSFLVCRAAGARRADRGYGPHAPGEPGVPEPRVGAGRIPAHGRAGVCLYVCMCA